MSDITPNRELHAMQKNIKPEEMKLSVKKQHLRIMELESSIKTIKENIKATEKDIAKMEEEK